MNASNKRRIEKKYRHNRVRKKVRGSADIPRLCVSKTSKHLYAQVIDDDAGQTLASSSTVDNEYKQVSQKRACLEAAKIIGEQVAAKAGQKGVKKVVFDRGGHPYHGLVKAVADGARSKGLDF